MGFGDFLQTVSPLLGLIPGAGMIAAPAANLIGGAINNGEQEKLMRQQQAIQNAPIQQNSNPYGFAMGGLVGPGDPPAFIPADKRAMVAKMSEEQFRHWSKLMSFGRLKLVQSKSGISKDPENEEHYTTPEMYARSVGFNKAVKQARDNAMLPPRESGRRYADGGYLNQTGPNTQEVIGNNPSKTDGVELPQAYVDHGETISNTSQGKYVFSDILKNPITGNSFAQDDKKLAMSDRKASAKPYDKEAQNTLMINQKLRDQLSTVNEITKTLSNLNSKGMATGGYMKPRYNNGGP